MKALDEGLRCVWGGWVLDVDLKSFFDTISHEKLRHVVSQRVADGVVKRSLPPAKLSSRAMQPRLANL